MYNVNMGGMLRKGTCVWCVALLLWMVSLSALCGQGVRIGAYNVESLYDTVRNALYDDADYTPWGALHWNTERYNTKLTHLARVIDDLGADILALEEVENETVVHDLVATLHSDYNYIHRTTADRRGMDQALLYRGAVFFPFQIEQRSGSDLLREVLMVRGLLRCDTVTLLVCHLPSQMNDVSMRLRAIGSLRRMVDSLAWRHPTESLIVMGDFNTPPTDRAMRVMAIGPWRESAAHGSELFVSPFLAMSRRGYGSLNYRDRRQLFDYILLNTHASGGAWCGSSRYGIFVRDYMLHPVGRWHGYPIRTFTEGRYTEGYSDHLPVFWDLERATH